MFTSAAVPMFMFISFYYLERGFEIQDNKKIQKRLQRLFIPQVMWTFILWVLHNILAFLKLSGHIGIKGFAYQLLLGHNYNPPMWFQVDLLIITLGYILLKKTSDKYFTLIITVLIPVCFYLQYTGWNYKLFEEFVYEVKYPLGRIVEVVPMCTLGVLCARFRLFDVLAKHKLLSCLACWLVFILCWFVHIICKVQTPMGFAYQGISLLVFSFAIVITFFYLPLLQGYFLRIVVFLSRYTLGVYCVHFFVGCSLESCLRFVGIVCNDFLVCDFIFCFSMIIVIIISKIPIPGIKSLVQQIDTHLNRKNLS